MAVQTHSGRILQLTRCLIVLGMTLTFATLAGTANAANLTLAWDANNEPDLAGYLVFCGESSGQYSITKEITSDNPGEAPPTACEFTGLEEGATYYFSAIAFSDSGKSDYSEEISYTVPAASVDPRTTDDDNDGYSENQGDCNDNNDAVNPDATDLCGDGIDQDCSGSDAICLEDIDNDGDGVTEADGDCDDTDNRIYPGAVDKCGDGIDQNCNGVDLACPDDNSLIREVQYGELEGDFKSAEDSAAASGQYVYVPEGVGNLMDGPDENQKVTFTFNIAERGTYRIKGTVYAPSGSDDSFWVKVNGSPAGGYLWDVLQNTSYQMDYVNDRNGADPVEVYLNVGANTVAVYLREDGTRLERIELEAVAVDPQETDDDGDGFTVAQGDCNDDSASQHPGATEVCGDGIDQDCSGLDAVCAEDIDNDGDGYTENQGDCNDANSAIRPGMQEICGDGIDQDCNGTDLVCPENIDNDNDGYTENQGDCNDTDAAINPGAADICGDGIDQDCIGGDPICDNVGDDPESTEVVSALPMEFGEVDVDDQWKTVVMKRPFDDPVVLVAASSYNDQDPVVIRVRNITGNSFEVRVQEWNYLDGEHALEKTGYIVVESGSYELPGGTRVEAGRFTASAVSGFDTVPFKQPFSTVPVVIATTTTSNESDAVTMRLRNITTGKFDYRIQEQEINNQQHVSEEAGYIAWEPSAGSLDDIVFEIGRTSNSVTHAFQTLNFYEPFSHPPVFLAGMQTTDGGDTAAVRCQNRQADGIDIKVEEEQSRDTEMNHTTEVIGYMVFEADNTVQYDDTQPVDSLVREAEDGVLSGRFDIGSDAAASGGKYVHVPGWSWRKSTPDEDQKVEYTFNVSNAGYYRIKGWVYAPDGSRDSFFVKVNGEPAAGYEWHVLRNTTYAPDYVRDGIGTDPVEIWVEKESTATVSVYQREAQTRLDKIELELVE